VNLIETIRGRKAWPTRCGRRRRPASLRWLAEARAVRARHRHRAARTGVVERVLRRPRAGIHRVTERWLLAARSVHPHVALSLQAVLRLRFAWGGGHTVLRTSGPDRRVGARDTAAGEIRAPMTIAEREWERERDPAQMGVAPPPRHRQTEPCRRVYQRARAPRDLLTTSHTVRPAPARPVSARLERLRRREERGPWTAAAHIALREGPPAPVAAARRPAVATVRTEAPARWAAAAPPAVDVAALPAPQIQALTDRVVQQIDRRLSAWRERNGLA
jgi:hypothetical protein